MLANELKNNANKLAKWTAAAHISGTDMIKLGYVTRATPKDNFNHVILGTQVGSSPATLAFYLQTTEDSDRYNRQDTLGCGQAALHISDLLARQVRCRHQASVKICSRPSGIDCSLQSREIELAGQELEHSQLQMANSPARSAGLQAKGLCVSNKFEHGELLGHHSRSSGPLP